ncbi:DUF2510 domain-containing protein [Amnibacterium sp.]|uniref:DUF2510 domain-containing protein n=1 Tax=Amnibacterium sp. TaxID=1872496 RepID=UPI002606059A|nr:DUF2510 domain-containing protein [Amnibacterium sp.]MCU1472225.1 hypothetical protein [Amnibacterium sp.]
MTTLDPVAASTAAAGTPQPGWYPDPQDPNGAVDRWWNGIAWSEHTRRRASGPAAPLAPAIQPAPAVRTFGVLHNGPAWWSFGLGLASLAIAVAAIASDANSVWLSTSGVLAVINGVRALRLRTAGLASALAAPIIGIAAGTIGSLLMLLLLLVPVGITSDPGTSGTLDGTCGSSAGSAAAAPAAPSRSAAPIPTPSQPLQVQPPSALPDDVLTTYTAVGIRSISSASAGCGVLTAPETAMPASTYRETEARHMQDWLSWESDSLRSGLQSYVKDTNGWPTRLDEDPQTRVLFTIGDDGSCDVVGPIPKGAEVRYAMSPDHGQVAIALYDTALKTGTLWRSVDDTTYWL